MPGVLASLVGSEPAPSQAPPPRPGGRVVSDTGQVAGLRGVDHNGTRYVALDDLLLLLERYREAWDGHDAGLALPEVSASLAEWSENTPAGGTS